MTTGAADVLRIGNASGFYGDRFDAMREMLTGGELDVLTGDYLAELTMLILGRDRLKDPGRGYAKTFLRQLEECLGLAHGAGRADRRQRGRPQPGRTRRRRTGAGRPARRPGPRRPRRGRRPHRAATRGSARPPTPTSAAPASPPACAAGADVVVTGRVTDAALVIGPAAAHFGWGPTTTTTRSPAPSSPATCWSAAPRPPAATTPSSTQDGIDAPPPRLPPRRDPRRRHRPSSPSTPAPAALVTSARSPRSCSTRPPAPATRART